MATSPWLVITLAITGATTIDNAIALTGNSTIDNESDAAAYSGAISGAYALTKTGAGTLTLSANNSYGATFVNAGTLSVDSDGNWAQGRSIWPQAAHGAHRRDHL